MKSLVLMLMIISVDCFALSPEEARHFLARTHFSVQKQDLKALEKLNRQQAVDWLFQKEKMASTPTAPYWMEGYKEISFKIVKLKRGKLEASEKNILGIKNDIKEMLAPIQHLIPQNLKNKLSQDIQSNDPKKLIRVIRKVSRRLLVVDLQNWWFEQMVRTPAPLTEKMTLFWHNHFPSSVQKVKNLHYLYRQNTIFREHALGSFQDLLFLVSKDPAMLSYLDGDKNMKKKPNENFAREVMELFTLGEGNYTEHDIKEAARAFTGWTINRQNGDFVFRKRRHDDGEKTFLGKKGSFKGEDILKILLEQRQTAEYISQKLWKYFAAVEADQALIKKLADKFFQSGYSISSLLKEILSCNEFYASKAQLIKSPVDLMVGAVKDFEIESDQYYAFVMEMSRLGQSLFNPPNVKGWPGGSYWINSASLVQRKAFLNRLVRVAERKSKGMKMGKQKQGMRAMNVQVDMQQWLSHFKDNDQLVFKMLPMAPVNSLDEKAGADLILAVILDPTYQLR